MDKQNVAEYYALYTKVKEMLGDGLKPSLIEDVVQAALYNEKFPAEVGGDVTTAVDLTTDLAADPSDEEPRVINKEYFLPYGRKTGPPPAMTTPTKLQITRREEEPEIATPTANKRKRASGGDSTSKRKLFGKKK